MPRDVNSPNENITWIRMGNGNNELINWTLLDDVWSKLQFVLCNNHVETINAHPWVTITNNGKIPQ
ncbi:MAG: hypothetical protein EBR91_11315, partial [Flavobacteriia bacterium]|nr:hypothetical protein [Flavobacteriia bacterium]